LIQRKSVEFDDGAILFPHDQQGRRAYPRKRIRSGDVWTGAVCDDRGDQFGASGCQGQCRRCLAAGDQQAYGVLLGPRFRGQPVGCGSQLRAALRNIKALSFAARCRGRRRGATRVSRLLRGCIALCRAQPAQAAAGLTAPSFPRRCALLHLAWRSRSCVKCPAPAMRLSDPGHEHCSAPRSIT
jgi:hypothetical protein